MFGIGTQEIILIVLVVLIFFGGKKIPELMKGLGKGVRSFKEGMNGSDNDSNTGNSGKDTSISNNARKDETKADDTRQ